VNATQGIVSAELVVHLLPTTTDEDSTEQVWAAKNSVAEQSN
jgi:hypothetical protein